MIRKWRTRLLSALLCASMVVPCAPSIGVQAEESSGYRYAVQLYGICVDQVYVSGEGDNVVTETGGLTFGPALGGNYTTKENTDALNQHYKTLSGQTASGNDHRCIHRDDWTTIIEWNNKDPYVYEDCIDQHCTHAVEITLTSANCWIHEDYGGNPAERYTKAFFYNPKYWSPHTGDGEGTFYYDRFPSWDTLPQGEYRTYDNSLIRAALNGYDHVHDFYSYHYTSSSSAMSAFPAELQRAIGRKAVRCAAAYNDHTNVNVVYDQLWLFAANEIFPNITDANSNYPNEGTVYARTRDFIYGERGDTTVYTYRSKVHTDGWMTRSLYDDDDDQLLQYILESRTYITYIYDSQMSVAPGFVLARTKVSDTGINAGASESPCNHSYEWEVYEKATATKDGSMRYRCKYCGDVQYQVPVTAYYTFNKDTQEAILKADANATVKVQTPLFISFHEMVRKALQERQDVTLVVDYKNGDGLYEMTIPAGSGDQLETLFGDSQFAGFLYLGGTYATTQLPEDTVFTNSPAELLWFGTTTAH